MIKDLWLWTFRPWIDAIRREEIGRSRERAIAEMIALLWDKDIDKGIGVDIERPFRTGLCRYVRIYSPLIKLAGYWEDGIRGDCVYCEDRAVCCWIDVLYCARHRATNLIPQLKAEGYLFSYDDINAKEDPR